MKRLIHDDCRVQAAEPAVRHAGRACAAATVGAAAAFAILGGPMLERATVHAQTTAAASGKLYSIETNPFEMDSRLIEVFAKLAEAKGDRAKIDSLFRMLRVGGTENVKTVKPEGRPPRTAAEAIGDGGDCTDFAFLVITLLSEQGIACGGKVVHFKGDPAGTDHMVPFAVVDGKEIIIDLQAKRLGETIGGEHAVLLTYTPKQAAAMYHREYGDYLRDQGKVGGAGVAYVRSLSFYADDPYVYQNLGTIYEKRGDMAKAREYFGKAAALDPSKSRVNDARRGSYNDELAALGAAYDKADFCGCVQHADNALATGEARKADSTAINQYRNACRKKCTQ